MITDDDARLLLARAGDTIRVDAATPSATPGSARGAEGRPRLGRVAPVAVAVAVLVIVGFALTIGRPGPDAAPVPGDRPAGRSVDRAAPPAPGDDEAPTAELREVADQFVAWARDRAAAPPRFADTVVVLADHEVVRMVDGRVDRRSLRICSGRTTLCYTSSALSLLRFHDGPLTYSRTPETVCADTGISLPEALRTTASGNLVRIGPARADSCADSFAVELTVDEAGDIEIVNAIVPID